MKTLLICLGFVAVASSCLAQNIERSTITAGRSVSSGPVAHTIGQLWTRSTSLLSGSYLLTQGFQQPTEEDFYKTSITEVQDPDLTFFSNPVEEKLWITWKSSERLQTLILRDLTGRLVQHHQISPDEISSRSTVMDLTSLSTGVYILEVVGGNALKHSSFKILKQ